MRYAKDVSQVHVMIENVFEIENPDEYECFIRRFNIGHSTMNILVRDRETRRQKFYVVFQAVEYYSGPIRWNGANFCVKSDEQALKVLRRVEWLDKFSDEKLLRIPPYRLYEVETKKDTIQIVARLATVSSKMFNI